MEELRANVALCLKFLLSSRPAIHFKENKRRHKRRLIYQDIFVQVHYSCNVMQLRNEQSLD